MIAPQGVEKKPLLDTGASHILLQLDCEVITEGSHICSWGGSTTCFSGST